MTVTELRDHLSELIREGHGDVKVTHYWMGRVEEISVASHENLKILSRREKLRRYWSKRHGDENKGEPVIQLA